MVSGEVGAITCRIKFTLSDGTNFILNSNQVINNNNYLTSIKLKEELSAENNIPVGVNSSTVLDLELISNNKALIPENQSSTYYGYMDETAIIEVYITESGDTLYFGKYFVNTWKSNITSEEPNKVIISATCIMGEIIKHEVPDVAINSGMMIKEYLIALIEELNLVLPSNRQINYRNEDIDFSTFPEMQFSNLDTKNMSNCLNGLSQCTLTNIYSDRDGYIKTDYCCDDLPEEATYELSVMYSAEAGSGNLINYDGVIVNYSLGNILDVEQIAGLYQQDVPKDGVNKTTHEPEYTKFENIDLGDAVYKINEIKITPEDKGIDIDIIDAKYNKNSMSLTLSSDGSTKADIKIFGQRLDDTELVYDKYKNKNNLEITNRIIPKKYIQKYTKRMKKLLGYNEQTQKFANNSMKVEGYFNPRIKLSDVVYVDCNNAMLISGYYKVVGLDWDLGAYGSCVMTLVKIYGSQSYDINVIMESLNEPLEATIANINVKNTAYVNLSSKENQYANIELNEELTELRELLYGGE